MHAVKMKYKSGKPQYTAQGLKIEYNYSQPPHMVAAIDWILYNFCIESKMTACDLMRLPLLSFLPPVPDLCFFVVPCHQT